MASDKRRVVLLTGGGSGGHITPLLAVATALKRLDATVYTVYVGQRGDKLGDIPAQHEAIDEVRAVSAGKLRRYHGTGLKQLLDVKTILLNIRDAFRTLAGLMQSVVLVRRLRPEVVFIKGGFVGAPVGLACALLRVPYITHDSDAQPGLANRLVAPWARVHAVALPASVYPYPASKTVTVGVPVVHHYERVTDEELAMHRERAGLQDYDQVLLVSGGGLGAQRLNDAVAASAASLLRTNPRLVLVHQAGRANEGQLSQHYDRLLDSEERSRVRVLGFVTNLHEYSAAADVVIARAGGTNLAELEIQGKACVVVPNPYLAGGHQLKNATVLAEAGAVVLVSEAELAESVAPLVEAVGGLLNSSERRRELGNRLSTFAQSGAATKLAELLLSQRDRS